MGVNEYILSLMAIVSGLAVTDMVSSLHGLLRRYRRVRWDVLPLSAAMLVFLAVLNSWFVAWKAAGWDGAPFWLFLITIFQLISLYLAAKAVLPHDDGSAADIVLLDFYWAQNRYVWLCLTATCVLTVGYNVSRGLLEGNVARFLLMSTPFYISAAVLLSLVFVQKLWWHRVIVTLTLLTNAALWFSRTLTATI